LEGVGVLPTETLRVVQCFLSILSFHAHLNPFPLIFPRPSLTMLI
jgi:hypothetical protein